jgi:RNA polymerase sigma-70 factor, ECF subfamily
MSQAVALDPSRLAFHLPRLTRTAIRLSGSREAGEDLVQETFLRVLRSPRSVKGADEYPYLARALRNTHVDRVRSAVREVQTTALTDALDAVLPAVDRSSMRSEAREVLAAVDALPARYREVILAVDVAGYSYAESAAALDIPVGTVMSRLYRGRQAVIQAIGDRS